MSKCENCVHYDVCREWNSKFIKHRLQMGEGCVCKNFKDKSLCVELLVKVGQTVYVPWEWEGQIGIAIATVDEIKFYATNLCQYMFYIDMESDDESFNQSFGGWKLDLSIGKTVFLTEEQAKTKLNEMGVIQ